MNVTDLPERVRSKIDPAPDTGCWVWSAAQDRRGYGRVRHGSRVVFAHRLVYELLADDPGPELDHLCRNPSCVNPDHLEPVMHVENVRRGESGRLTSERYAASRECPQGHPLVGNNLYVHRTKNGYLNRQCKTCRRETKRLRRAAGKRD